MKNLRCKVFLLLGTLCVVSFSFNVDTNIPIVKQGRVESLFGFSVAQHFVTGQEGRNGESYVLVGAPKDNVTLPGVSADLMNTVRPGVVYKCPFTSSTDDCSPLRIDLEEPSKDMNKNDQWFGVTVSSQPTHNGKAVACGHRYQKVGVSYVWGVGICVSMTNNLEEEEIWEPCAGKSMDQGHGEYGFCEAGISSSISEDGDLLLGAPGSYNWRGNIFKNTVESGITTDNKWLQSPVEDPHPSLINNVEPATNYYSYLGMSVKIGNLINGRKTYIAGAPRSKDFGQVLLFEADEDSLEIKAKHYLTGPQFGSMFGYALTTIDMNSDGKEDLVVGAPFEHGKGIGGAIYIYLNSQSGITSSTVPIRIGSRKMNETECLSVDCTNARFGFAVANAGDVDKDGYADLVVGAPFEGRGVVYLFRGSSHGIDVENPQRISAADLKSSLFIKGFGYSLSAGQDMDFNGYPDIVAGAFSSDHVVILRTRPVVNVNATLAITPRRLDASAKNCSFDASTNNCFEMTVCFKFAAERINTPQEIEYKMEAERDVKLVRVQFKDVKNEIANSMTNSITLKKQNFAQCRTHIAYIIKNNRDFLSPILVELSYKLKENAVPRMVRGRKLPDINQYPILNEARAFISTMVHFKKNCARESECLSNLELKTTIKGYQDILEKNPLGENIVRVGFDEELRLEVLVTNSEEEAHEANLFVTLPRQLVYKGTDERGKQYACEPNENIVSCQLGNPLRMSHEARFVIRLDPSSFTDSNQLHNISILVNTTSKDMNILDNLDVLKLRTIIEADLEVRGQSFPMETFCSGSSKHDRQILKEIQIGPQIEHRYEVKNLGYGTVPTSELTISWPHQFENSKYLLYLMENPKTEGPISCSPYLKGSAFKVNPLQVEKIKSQNTQSLAIHDGSARSRRSKVFDPISEINDEGRNLHTEHIDCDNEFIECVIYTCTIGVLQPGKSVIISFRSRLMNSTFIDDYKKVDRIRIFSKAIVSINPNLNVTQINYKNDVARVSTLIQPDQELHKSPGVDLWIIILAVCLGIILLLLLILLLWRCGFFNRRKADEMATHKAKLEHLDEPK